MSKILVAYTTNAGSTEEVAQAVAEQLGRGSRPVDLRRLEEVRSVTEYNGVVIGAPMILGWSRSAVQFLRRHRADLARRRVACFCTLMSLTDTGPGPAGIPVAIDPGLPCPPKNPQRLSIKESYATLSNYLRPLQRAAPQVQPVSIAMLGGKMEMFRLKWWQALFVMGIIQARPGDLRNWDFIRQWARGLEL